MPKDLLYASFKDAPYTSQFVGSIAPELKDAQQVLNQTYDLSKESDSKLAAVARDMAQKAHPKDTKAAQALFEDYSAKLAERAKSGRYEDMLHETTNDARQFNVNASKIVAEKQRVDNYIKQLDEDKTINAERKAGLKAMALSGQNQLQYDKNQGLVVGEGFKEDPFAKDYNFASKIDEGFGKGFIPDIIGGSGSQFIKDEKTGLPLLIDSKKVTKQVKAEDIENAVAKYLTDDPEAQAHIDREARQIAFEAGYKDWRNIPKDLYQKAHSQAAYNLTNNAIKAAGIKYGFTQTETDSNSKMLNEAYLGALGGKSKTEELNKPQPYNDVTIKQKLNPLSWEDLQKSLQPPTSKNVSGRTPYGQHNVISKDISNLEFTDPISGETKSGKDLKAISRAYSIANPRKANPYPRIISTLEDKAVKQNTPSSNKKEISLDEIIKTNNPDFNGLAEIKAQLPGVAGKDVYDIWKNYKEKSIALTRKVIPIKPDLRDQYNDLVLGNVTGEGKDKSRTGGMFFNQPVIVYKEGSDKPMSFDSGEAYLEDEGIDTKELLNITVEGQSSDYKNTEGAYVSKGKLGGDNVRIYTLPSDPQREYSKPLSTLEASFDSGTPVSFEVPSRNYGTLIVESNPFSNLNIDVKNKKVGDYDPEIIVKSTDGKVVMPPMKYSVFKNEWLNASPYRDAIQSKKVSNQSNEDK